jgi:hypothetical protein
MDGEDFNTRKDISLLEAVKEKIEKNVLLGAFSKKKFTYNMGLRKAISVIDGMIKEANGNQDKG